MGEDGKFWLTGGQFFGYVDEAYKLHEILNVRCYSLLLRSNDEIWVGSIEGLYHYKGDSIYRIEHPELKKDIRDIKIIGDGDLLLATQKNGLYHYRPSDNTIINHFSTENGLSNNNCTKLLIDEKYIWLGTKKGVNRINIENHKIAILALDQGLPSNEVNDILKFKNDIYTATNKGLAIFDSDIKLDRPPPRLQITNIKIDERDTSFYKKYHLGHAKNNIKIEFDAITFRDAEQAIYEYKMEGLDRDWLRSTINTAQYPSLPPGDFLFSVRTKTVNSDWSAIQTIGFNIDAPFWKSWWFYLLMVLLTMAITYLIFYIVMSRRHFIKDVKESQLTALRAQMNPHFIFNALNSIQEFIINKDSRAANKYLSQFARLMRNILHVADKKGIYLNKEIESLKLYLSLEALRFGDAFEYVMEVSESINQETTYLPPMLIQPFVENAIKHGLMHKEGQKNLYIRFCKQDNTLICEVEDNGIGRKKSSEIKQLNANVYLSKGTGLIQERVKLLNAVFNQKVRVEVIDLENQEAEAIGTKVRITIQSKGYKKQ